MKHPTQEQLLNAAVKLDDAYPAVAAWLVRMAKQPAAEPVAGQTRPLGYLPKWAVDRLTGDQGKVADPLVWGLYTHVYLGQVDHGVAIYTQAPTQQPLTDEQKAVLRECRKKAMKWAAQAGIPECAAFGEVAQDLDWLCGQLGITENEKGGAA